MKDPTRSTVCRTLVTILIVLVVFRPASVEGKAPGHAAIKASLTAYFETIVRPSLSGNVLSETTLETLYSAFLSNRTRAGIGAEEFVLFWRQLAATVSRYVFKPSIIAYDLSEPVLSEGGNEALILATIRYGQLFPTTPAVPARHVLFGCVAGMDPAPATTLECAADSRAPFLDAYRNANAIYRVVNEAGAWKTVLPDALIAEMRRLTPQITARRYPSTVEVAEGEVKVRVVEVLLQRDATRLRLAITNAGRVPVSMTNALSLARLADDAGTMHATYILRSDIPEVVAAESTVGATLAFEPVPLSASWLVLSIPQQRLDGSEIILRVEIPLRPSVQTEPRATIVGAPVLYFLLTTTRLQPTDEVLRTLYERHMAKEVRQRVTFREVAAYYQSGAIESWLCQFDFPYQFILETVTAHPTERALVRAEALQGALPSSSGWRRGGSPTTFEVVKENGDWRLLLPDDLLKGMQAPRATSAHHRLDAREESFPGVPVYLDDVALEPFRTVVRLRVFNETHAVVQIRGWTTTVRLQNRFDDAYLPQDVSGRETIIVNPAEHYDWEVTFRPLPVESRWFSLTVGEFRLGNEYPRNVTFVVQLPCF